LWGAKRFRCALGRGGVSKAKREGDGVTPVGAWTMRRLLFRPDRITAPRSQLLVAALLPNDGWCDEPEDALYNQLVRLPYPARAETL
jgi:L,D-peptidoglycan transpeptidase YkuD (ErfK/YbiS/YcfS/YnhG family)